MKNLHAQGRTNTIDSAFFILSFLHDSIEIADRTIQFNHCRIINPGSKELDLKVSIEGNDQISLLTSSTSDTHLQSGQQLLWPFRFSVNNVGAEKWVPVRILVYNKLTGQKLEQSFYVRAAPVHKWQCSLLQPTLEFHRVPDSQYVFQCRLINEGSYIEHIKVTADKADDVPVDPIQTVTVEPHTEKIISIPVAITFASTNKGSKQIRLFCSDERGLRMMLLQTISLSDTVYTGAEDKYHYLPVTLEGGVQHNNDGSSFYTGRLTGNFETGARKHFAFDLSYYHPGRNVWQQFTGGISYETNRWKLYTGSLVNIDDFPIPGKGVRIERKGENATFSLTGLYSNPDTAAFAQACYQQMPNRRFSLISEVNWYQSHQQFFSSKHKLRYEVNAFTQFWLEVGYGKSSANSTIGNLFGYRFNSTPKKWAFHSELSAYSANYPGSNKGFQTQSHSIKKQWDKNILSLFYQSSKNINSAKDSGYQWMNINTAEAGFSWQHQLKTVHFSWSISRVQQREDSLTGFAWKSWQSVIAFTTQWKKNWQLMFYSTNGTAESAVYTHAPTFYTASFASFQYKSASLLIQLDAGPHFFYEVKQYFSDGKAAGRYMVSPTIQYRFLKNKFSGIAQLNWTKQPDIEGALLITNELHFPFKKSKAEADLHCSYNVTNVTGSYIELKIRKQLNLRFRNDKSFNSSIQLYKDVNGNGHFDSTDLPLTNIMVLMNGQWVHVNEWGIIELKTISTAPLLLDFSKTNGTNGWSPFQGSQQVVYPTEGQSPIEIAFIKTRRIYGQLKIIKDPTYSSLLSMGNIRMTLTDEAGKIIETLTGEDGTFHFNVPPGHYLLQLNESIFSDQYLIENPIRSINLLNDETASVIFIAVQKRRKIEIQREK